MMRYVRFFALGLAAVALLVPVTGTAAPGLAETQTYRAKGAFDRVGYAEQQQLLHDWLVSEQVTAGVDRPFTIRLSKQERLEISQGSCKECKQQTRAMLAGMVKPVSVAIDMVDPKLGAARKTAKDGLVWSAPQSTGIAGQICAPLYLDDGRLFAAYVHRHDPPSLRALLSADGGQTWDREGELVFYAKDLARRESGMQGKRDFGDYWADMNIWTFGHPAVVQLANGELMVAYYAGDSTAMGIHWVRIDPN